MRKSKCMTQFMSCHKTKIDAVGVIAEEDVSRSHYLKINTYFCVHCSAVSKRILPSVGKYAYARVVPGPSKSGPPKAKSKSAFSLPDTSRNDKGAYLAQSLNDSRSSSRVFPSPSDGRFWFDSFHVRLVFGLKKVLTNPYD
jgi:hypothetical protein